MSKQQAWDEWHKGVLGNKAPDIKLSSHGRAFSAGWDASEKQRRLLRKLLTRAASARLDYTTGKHDKLLDAIDRELA